MSTNGWIKIHRRLKEWVYYNNSTMVHLFLHLLLSANHTDVTKDGLILKRGQVLMSIPKMSQETGITVKVIRGLLSKLESTGEIRKETVPIIWGTTFGTTSRTTKAPTSTLVTICKYEDYQYEAEKEGTTSGVTSGTTSGTYKEEYIKNNKKENNSSLRSELQKDGFEEFWQAYGYKKSKETARKAWRNLSQKDRNAAMQAIPAYRQDCERCQRSMQYPATYLHKRTWEDDYNINDYGTNSNSKQQNGGYVRQPTPSENIEAARTEQLQRIAELDTKAEAPTFDVFPKL